MVQFAELRTCGSVDGNLHVHQGQGFTDFQSEIASMITGLDLVFSQEEKLFAFSHFLPLVFLGVLDELQHP